MVSSRNSRYRGAEFAPEFYWRAIERSVGRTLADFSPEISGG